MSKYERFGPKRSRRRPPALWLALLAAVVLAGTSLSFSADELMGSDQQVGRLPFDPPQLSPKLTDVDRAAAYSYVEENCDTLLTDIGQEVAYSIQGQVVEVTKVTDEEENELGAEFAKQVAETFAGRLDVDRQWLAYVEDLGRHLASGVERQGINWHFHVIEENKVNAFAIPGGGIYVFTGMLRALDNEAQLAVILGHEIKHVDLRHCIAMYQVLARLPEAMQNPISFAVTSFIQQPYNPRVEADADRRGVELAYAFGYSPYQAVAIWEKFGNKYGLDAGGLQIPKVGDEEGGLIGGVLERVSKEVENVTTTHPKASKRACLLRNHTLKLQAAHPAAVVYVGAWNYQSRVPMYKKQK
ncbi:MAG: M48 family metalloprotease [Thermodesulfobacteriota bacterium]